MSKLEELLEKSEVWFEIGSGKYDRRRLLYWAKKQGLRWWPKGREIKGKEECFFHMVVMQNKMIANIPFFCWIIDKENSVCRLNFKEFLKAGV